MVDIGKRLRELREAKGLSQRDVEARTGLPRDEISNIEIGNVAPTLEMLDRWANALGVDLQQLFAVGQEPRESPALPERIPVGAQERRLLKLFRQMPAEDKPLLISLALDMVKLKGDRG